MSNNNGNNNNYKERKTMEQELMTVNCSGFKLADTGWTFTTPVIQNDVVELISGYGVAEIDSVYMWPQRDKSGNIVNFGMVAYFIVDNSNKGNITRVGANNNGKSSSNSLRSRVTNKGRSGDFIANQQFISALSPIAMFDDDGNIVINSDPGEDNGDDDNNRRKENNLAMVYLDFWKVMALLLGVRNDSPCDFEITECNPLNNSKNCIDFVGKVRKIANYDNTRRSKKNRFNYENRNRRLLNSGGWKR